METLLILLTEMLGNALGDAARQRIETYFRETPEFVNINLVLYGKDTWKNHLRIINLAPVNMRLLEAHVTLPRSEKKPITHLWHPSRTADPFGDQVHNRIQLSEDNGIFLYREGLYYCPLSELDQSWTPDPKDSLGKAEVKFRTLEGGVSEPITLTVPIVHAKINVKDVFRHRKQAV